MNKTNKYYWMDVVGCIVWLLVALIAGFIPKCDLLVWISLATAVFYAGWAMLDLRKKDHD